MLLTLYVPKSKTHFVLLRYVFNRIIYISIFEIEGVFTIKFESVVSVSKLTVICKKNTGMCPRCCLLRPDSFGSRINHGIIPTIRPCLFLSYFPPNGYRDGRGFDVHPIPSLSLK
jgi:hypothetical protein